MNDNWKIKTPDNVYYEVDAHMTTLINNMGKIIYARKESIDADRRDLENLFTLVRDEFAKSEVELGDTEDNSDFVRRYVKAYTEHPDYLKPLVDCERFGAKDDNESP